MKRTISLIFALICVLSLCACTQKQEPSQPTAAPAAVPSAAPAVESTAAPEIGETPESPVGAAEPQTSLFDTAKALEGENVEELLSAVGEPVSREDYTPSCLGDGEDGLWHYADFDVYTYREGENESVYAVMVK